MKQIFLLTVLLTISLTTVVAQESKSADSARVAYLKNQLKSAKGKAEVDLLNDLAWEYTWNGLGRTYKANVEYAQLAKEKSEMLDYKKGLGYALLNLSWNTFDSECDSMLNAAMVIGQKENDFRLIGRVYHRRWEMKPAFEYFHKAGDLQGEAEAAAYLCDEYSKKGQYDGDGFKYCQRAIDLAGIKKIYTPGYSKFISAFTFEIMSDLFSKVGDYGTAFNYLKQTGIDENINIAELYQKMGKNDSALMYFEKAYKINPGVRGLNRQVGSAHLLNNNFEKAAGHLESSLAYITSPQFKQDLPKNYLGSLHVELGDTYTGLKNIPKAASHFTAAIKDQQPNYYKILSGTNNDLTEYQKQNVLMEIADGLSKSFFALGKIDSAYYFLHQYVRHRDRINDLNTLWRLNLQLSNYRKSEENQKRISQLKLLNKENQVKEAKLKQERFMKNGLAAGLLLLLLTGFFTFRTLYFKRKSERLRREQLENELTVKELKSRQEQAELERKATELEMQALRAQMNPHFIFNCLSSINRFVLKNETETASDYLTRFSRLIRLVLINSQKTLITLEDEIEMLRLYLDMERLRFKNAFDYNITFANSIDAGNVMMPPLLLQPFCENAIWHGLMHKQGQGRLDLVLTMEEKVLHCTITDNGIGRKKASEINNQSGSKSKSLGLKITSDRLALLNRDKGIDTSYEIEDLYEREVGTGTKVSLKISCNEMTEELDTNIKAAVE